MQNINSIKPILRRALQPQPEARFQTAAEFIQKLEAIDDMENHFSYLYVNVKVSFGLGMHNMVVRHR